MIFNEILNTYLGWYPRFYLVHVRATKPLTYLSFIGKATLMTILPIRGLYNISM